MIIDCEFCLQMLPVYRTLPLILWDRAKSTGLSLTGDPNLFSSVFTASYPALAPWLFCPFRIISDLSEIFLSSIEFLLFEELLRLLWLGLCIRDNGLWRTLMEPSDSNWMQWLSISWSRLSISFSSSNWSFWMILSRSFSLYLPASSTLSHCVSDSISLFW